MTEPSAKPPGRGKPLHQRAVDALDQRRVPPAVEAKGPEAVADFRRDRTMYSIACSLISLNRTLHRYLPEAAEALNDLADDAARRR